MIAGAVLVVMAPDSSAQWFGPKKSKTPPAQRVAELITTLKADKDSSKRASAAEELRQFDAKEFPDIVPALIDALQNDSGASVRVEAATGLGRLRPISNPAGLALEKAVANDPNLRVKLQAKASLTFYQLSGYHSPKTTDGQTNPQIAKPRTDEPPLPPADPSAANKWWNNGPAPDKASAGTIQAGPTNYNQYRPLPQGPVQNPQGPVSSAPASQSLAPPLPVSPTIAPTVQPPSAPQGWVPAPSQEGPSLSPPK
jgi:hypothetical protein